MAEAALALEASLESIAKKCQLRSSNSVANIANIADLHSKAQTRSALAPHETLFIRARFFYELQNQTPNAMKIEHCSLS